MSEIFYISDLHFGHSNTWNGTFKKENGEVLRPFSSNEEMTETLIKNINSRVTASDKLYILGDVMLSKKYLWCLGELNGKKRLVLGNHDQFDISLYREYFGKILGSRQMGNMNFTHIPIEYSTSSQRWKYNIHGHLHGKVVNNPYYLSVCVEQTNFFPLSMDEIQDRIKQNEYAFDHSKKVINFSTGTLYGE